MIKKSFLFLIAFVFTVQFAARADEGMWLLTMLNKNYDQMKAQGFKLKAEDIYSLNKPGIKDAIVSFGGFCTGEIISSQGLILTNHHCGYGAIQEHSTVEHDYLENGFWAMSKEEELYTAGLFVRFLINIEDVTPLALANVTDKMSEADRKKAIEENIKKIEADNKKKYEKEKYEPVVRPFFNGNAYYLMIFETYTDVRLVGAPPSSIGKFGADTDNWMWPRHTGDFSMFRVYSGPDGKPAEYSPKNIPLKPRHFLPVSLKGVKKDDFAMILGYPGRTNRYLTSWGVQELLDIENPNREKIRGIRQEIIMTDMQADPKIKIQYSSKYASSANYWKYSIGQNKGLKRLKVYDKKVETETRFTNWVNQNEERKAKYGDALNSLKNVYESRRPYYAAQQYLMECLSRGIEISQIARSTKKLYAILSDPSKGDAKVEAENVKKYAVDFYKDYSPSTDLKVAKAMLKLYFDDVKPEFHPSVYGDINSKYKNDFGKFAEELFANSIFADQAKFNKFIENPTKEALENDPAYKMTVSLDDKFMEIRKKLDEIESGLPRALRLFLGGLMEMDNTKTFYPDANSTLRLTYGKVGDYSPADGVRYDYFTTLDGVMEKEDPNNWEFVVKPKLKELWKNKDYGRYGKNGVMVVCFTTNNDITGGNSGSPVINGNGELIGTAFDGNWEAMSGDIAFETQYQKTIVCDIRYVLFIVDKFAGAKHLVDEMKIVE